MKTIFVISGVVIAAMVMFISSSRWPEKATAKWHHFSAMPASPSFKWTQVAPPGSGTHQYEWKRGTYPSALIPIVAFNGHLWMIGQKRSWSSKDGIQWLDHDKTDWGERISMGYVFFKDRFFVLGGMDYPTNTFLNEIWSSSDGKTWSKTTEHAGWSPRKGMGIAVFNNRLWLYGGATAVTPDRMPDKFLNDIWSSSDGVRWKKMGSAPWSAREYPRLAVFKGALWLIGGQGHSDIWRSDDGINWKQVRSDCSWGDRYDYGTAVFDNLLWVYGGETQAHEAYHDVWFSQDGFHWQLQTESAGWTPRSGTSSAVFRDKLWLYGGKHKGHKDSFSGDIWTMSAARQPVVESQ